MRKYVYRVDVYMYIYMRAYIYIYYIYVCMNAYIHKLILACAERDTLREIVTLI